MNTQDSMVASPVTWLRFTRIWPSTHQDILWLRNDRIISVERLSEDGTRITYEMTMSHTFEYRVADDTATVMERICGNYGEEDTP